ncbi:pyocin S6 family toxin immunity protein [Pseudomonas moraviensis]|uniref:pyocin S6 family toxin immunity protein n=1 Tax=Pseudomonas moraviensis TaxID=321662 RepID=UPI0020933A65|nr:pyocin S6 family toxin immunity protein [Pseudomonas moraviensis]UST60098.1 pyocin S6 family toxin immunity protein [Pseudomonas moraviensis]
MRFLSITGFFPDEVHDDSLQFELDITGSEMNERVAQLIESKPLGEVEPGELLLTQDQVTALENLLSVSFPKGLEYFMGTCVKY